MQEALTTHRKFETIRDGFALVVLTFPTAALSSDHQQSLVGLYRSDELCRAFDTQASIERNGDHVSGYNETGEKSLALTLSDRVIFCFGRVGHLSDDGETLHWDNGGVWRRSHITRF